MGNRPRQPLTVEQIQENGPPVRISDLMAISGLSQFTIVSDIRARHLTAQRRILHRKNAPYYIDRAEARKWLKQMGFFPATNGHTPHK